MKKHFYPAFGHLILAIVLFIPGIHKLLGEIPPTWFKSKFENSLLDLFSYGLHSSYAMIMIIEICGGVLLVSSSARCFLNKPSNYLASWGIFSAHLLFVLLTFGNFLVEDYNGAFQDFMYFVGVVVINRILLSK